MKSQEMIKSIGMIMLFTAGILTYYFIDQSKVSDRINSVEKENTELNVRLKTIESDQNNLGAKVEALTNEIKRTNENLSALILFLSAKYGEPIRTN